MMGLFGARVGLYALFSHWARAPLQLGVVIIGLALATGLWTAVQAINAEARASYAAAEGALRQGSLARLVAPSGGLIAPEVFVEYRRSGWLVSPVFDTSREIGSRTLRLVGIDALTAPPGSTPATLQDVESFGRFLNGEIVFAAPDVRWPGVEIRIDRSLPRGTVVGDLARVWELTGTRGLSHLLILPDQPLIRNAVERGLIEQPPAGAEDAARLTESFHLNLTAFGLLSFGVGLFIVQSAIGLAFEQRRPLFRTLRALGVPLSSVMGLLAAEASVLALIGGSLGVLLGYGVAAALLPGVAATLGGLYGANVPGTLSLAPGWIVGGFVVAALGCLMATGQSFWQLARMPLLSPAKPRAWAMAAVRRLQWLAGCGLALLCAAGLLAVLGEGLVAGFVMLAGLLGGAALVLPLLLSSALKRAEHLAQRPIAQWVWADARQQLPGLSLALMALLLALATNVGVGTMVQSFRLTFTGWLDQRLVSELYVRAETDELGDALAEFATPLVDAVLPIRSAQMTVLGQPAEVFGIIDHATYRDHWPLLFSTPSAWDAVVGGVGLLVNEQMYRRNHLALGDQISLAADWSLPVVGVYSDYGNPRGQAIAGLKALEARVGNLDRTRYGLRVAPCKVEAVRLALIDTFGLPPQRITDQSAAKSLSLEIFERTFLVSGALNILTLGVASFALLASLLTLSAMRLPQIAPAWAMGLTQRQLGALELGRALCLAAMTWVLAVPLGLALAWALLAVVNVEAFGWRLPMFIFPSQWLMLALWAGAAAVLAAAWPAWKLASIAPARLTAVFANAR